ncbi:uncharacterized protein TM35_000071000 [Trypanosoma theileri]|uniref:Uncharacterized protein n=1 Tax=Trypanosoma theileri TaxID=67003 RepID=A0A1X0P152_9TRYP|nr:uncharacterized protein TM35_000071000 [Trypanosoma theileri]ORC90676.1 hypothetical protein TM35_000071000 [Trypanosoma theileri]
MAKRSSVSRVYFHSFHNSHSQTPCFSYCFDFFPVFFLLFAGGPICRAATPHTTPNNKERHCEGERGPFPSLFEQFMLKPSWRHPFEIPPREGEQRPSATHPIH